RWAGIGDVSLSFKNWRHPAGAHAGGPEFISDGRQADPSFRAISVRLRLQDLAERNDQEEIDIGAERIIGPSGKIRGLPALASFRRTPAPFHPPKRPRTSRSQYCETEPQHVLRGQVSPNDWVSPDFAQSLHALARSSETAPS